MNQIARATAFLLPLFIASSTLAMPTEPIVRIDSVFGVIAHDLDSGALSEHDARMQSFYGLFRPDLLDERYADSPRDDAPACATTMLADIRAHWNELSGSEKHQVEEATSPFYRAWLDQGGISWEQGDVTAVQAEERATCFGPSQAFSQGGPYDHTHATDSFSIRYNVDSDVTHNKVESLGSWLEEAYSIEHEEMGFYLPNELLNYDMLVMVEPLPSQSTGGFTSYAPCGFGGNYMAFVVINSQWFDDDERLQSVAAHEFFHGIQIEYALAEMWGNPDTPNRWWVEASAVYMETEVYPTLYNSQASQAFRWILEPWRSLTTYDNTGYQYGTYLFAASVREGIDDTAWFHDLWDQIFGRSGYDLIEEFDSLLQDHDSSFEEQWGRFMEHATTGDFDFNSWLPGPGELYERSNGFYDNSTTAEHDADDLPLSESINNSSGLDRPEYLGVNYVYIDGQGLDENLGLIIRFDGAGEKNNTELAWEVRLVAVEDDDPKLTWDLELTMHRDDDGVLDKWTGEVLLNDFGEDFDGVYLIASPTVDFGNDGVTWGYEAELTHSRADGSFQAEWEDEEEEEDDDNGGGTACACATSPGAAGAAPFLGLLLFAGIVLRRSRTS